MSRSNNKQQKQPPQQLTALENASPFAYQKYRLTSNGLLVQDEESNVLYSDVLSEVNRLFKKSKEKIIQNQQDGDFELINQNSYRDEIQNADVLVQLFRDKNGRHKKVTTTTQMYEPGEEVNMNDQSQILRSGPKNISGMAFKTNSVEEMKRNKDMGINIKGLSFYETNLQPTYIYSITTHAEPEANSSYFESKDIKSPLINKLSTMVPPQGTLGFGLPGMGTMAAGGNMGNIGDSINTENNINNMLGLMNAQAKQRFGKNLNGKSVGNSEGTISKVPGSTLRQPTSGTKQYGGVRSNNEYPASNNNAVYDGSETASVKEGNYSTQKNTYQKKQNNNAKQPANVGDNEEPRRRPSNHSFYSSNESKKKK